MTKQERFAGIFLILIGVLVVGYTLASLKIGTINQPGPGFFPIICGIGIIFLSAIWILVNRTGAHTSEPFWEADQWCAPLMALVVMTVYTALMEPLGYIFSTLLFLGAWQIFVEHEKWLKTSIIATVGTVVMYFVFAYLLGLALPEGMFGI
jgi:putative tricarboxylic transport membrane protein